MLGNLWEFPGGKLGDKELPKQACKRLLKERVNLKVREVEYLFQIYHSYTHFKNFGQSIPL